MGMHAAPRATLVSRLVDACVWLSKPVTVPALMVVTLIRETIPAYAPYVPADETDGESSDPLAALMPQLLSTDSEPAAASPVQQELTESVLPARLAVDTLHRTYPDLPRESHWAFPDASSALLRLDAIGATLTDDELRGLVAAYAAVLAVQPQETPREPADLGYIRVSAAGRFRGVRIAVEAVVSPDPDDTLERIYRYTRAEDDTQAFAAIVVEEAMSA